MATDFLESLKFMGFTARIKRLSDGLLYDSKQYYKDSKFDIEPNWHIIFLLLKKERQLTVTQLAKQLKFSHPALIKITKKMKDKGYLSMSPDPTDSRKTQIQLSPKSLSVLPQLEEQWVAMEEVIKQVVDVDLLHKLTEIESKLRDQSISQRFQQKSTSK